VFGQIKLWMRGEQSLSRPVGRRALAVARLVEEGIDDICIP
jgi:hypothetical protein